jgi:hypothetical protein
MPKGAAMAIVIRPGKSSHNGVEMPPSPSNPPGTGGEEFPIDSGETLGKHIRNDQINTPIDMNPSTTSGQKQYVEIFCVV